MQDYYALRIFQMIDLKMSLIFTYLNAYQDFRNGEGETPIVMNRVQANITVTRYIRVKSFG